MVVHVALDERVAADLLALVTTIQGYGDDWSEFLGRAGEAVEPLREAIRVDVALDGRDRIADAASSLAEKQGQS